jgi:hypothetical protein
MFVVFLAELCVSNCQLVFENNIDRYAPAVHDCPHVAARDTRERPPDAGRMCCRISSSSRSGVDRRHKLRTDRRAEHGQFHERGIPHMLQHQCLKKNGFPAGHPPATCQRGAINRIGEGPRTPKAPRRRPPDFPAPNESPGAGPPHVSMALSPVPASTSPVAGGGLDGPAPIMSSASAPAAGWSSIPPCNACWIRGENVARGCASTSR